MVNSDNFYDIFMLYTPNIAYDYNHLKASVPYSINNIFIARKTYIEYNTSDKYVVTYQFKKSAKICYLNNPEKHPFYFLHLSECKQIESMCYNINKSMYLHHLEKNKLVPKSYSYDTFCFDVLEKKPSYIVKWLNKSLDATKITPHQFPVIPSILNDSHITYTVKKEDGVTYRDYIDKRTDTINERHQTGITVVMLFRNTEQYLQQAIESVFEQTYDRWFIVIVNDNSDAGPLIIDEYIDQRYKKFRERIKVINCDVWQGLCKCHRLAIEHVETDLIAVLDSDDTYEKTALADIVYTYNSSAEFNIFVYANFIFCDKDLKKYSLGFQFQPEKSYLSDRPGVACRSFRKSSYEKIRGYDDDMVNGAEDQDMFFQLEQYATPVYLNKYLYNYRRVNHSSISMMKRVSTFSLELSVIKNTFYRYGYVKFYLKVYSNKTPEERRAYIDTYQYKIYSESTIVLNGVRYIFEFNLNRTIRFMTYANMSQYEKFKTLLDPFIERYNTVDTVDTENEFEVRMVWDPICAQWMIDSDQTDTKYIDIEKCRILSCDKYFDKIYILTNNIQRYIMNYTTTFTSVEQILRNTNELSMKKIGIMTINTDTDFTERFDKSIRTIAYDWKVLVLGYEKNNVDTIDTIDNNILMTLADINDIDNTKQIFFMALDLSIVNEILNVIPDEISDGNSQSDVLFNILRFSIKKYPIKVFYSNSSLIVIK